MTDWSQFKPIDSSGSTAAPPSAPPSTTTSGNGIDWSQFTPVAGAQNQVPVAGSQQMQDQVAKAGSGAAYMTPAEVAQYMDPNRSQLALTPVGGWSRGLERAGQAASDLANRATNLLGLGDRIAATTDGNGATYTDRLKDLQQKSAEAAARTGGAGQVVDLAGTGALSSAALPKVLTAGAPEFTAAGEKVSEGLRYLKNIGYGIVGGGVTGAVGGAAQTPADAPTSQMVNNAIQGGGIGAVIGGAVPGVLGAPGAMFAPPASSAGQDAAEASRRLGFTLSNIAASDSPVFQRVGQAIAGTPAGTAIPAALQRDTANASSALENVANQIGNSAAPNLVGGDLRTSLNNTVQNAEQTGINNLQSHANTAALTIGNPSDPNLVGNQLRTGLDGLVQNQTQRGEAAMQSEINRIVSGVGTPANPAQAGGNLRNALTDFVKTTSREPVRAGYEALDNAVDPTIRAPLPATMAVLQDIASRRAAAGLPGEGAASRLVMELATRPGGATAAGIKDLRSNIGETLDRGILPDDFSGEEGKKVYAGLSQDLPAAYNLAGGPDAEATYRNVNTLAAQTSERNRDIVSRLLGPGKSDEQLFSTLLGAAQDGGRANVALLNQVRGVIPQQQWNNFGASVIGQIGRDASGNYSPELFSRNYSKLSQDGRNAIFSQPQQAAINTAITNAQTHLAASNRVNQFVSKVAGPGKSDEGVFSTALGAAQAGGQANAKLLMQLKTSVPARDWSDLGATVISRMGKDNNGNFSPEQFLQDNSKLSPIGRSILFTPQQRTAIDNVASQAQQHLQNITPFKDLSSKLLGPGKSDEQLFSTVASAAQSGGRANANLLMQVKSAVPSAQWNDFSASVVGSMGKDNNGQFSPAIFLSQYSKLSDVGKNTLLTPAQRSALDDLATAVKPLKTLSKLANTSNTGNVNAFLHMAIAPLSTLTSAFGGSAMASFMAKPAAVRSISSWSQAYGNFMSGPTMQAAKGLQSQTKNLAVTLATQLGDIKQAPQIEQSLLNMNPLQSQQPTEPDNQTPQLATSQ